MKFTSNKEKGNAGMAIAIAYFAANGYIVSIPLNDTQDYDILADDGNKINKIQVKATGVESGYQDGYSVSLRSSGGTNGSTYKTVRETDVDYLFVLTASQSMFLLPFDVVKNNVSTIRVSPTGINSEYLVKL
jgi:hypothetical protein